MVTSNISSEPLNNHHKAVKKRPDHPEHYLLLSKELVKHGQVTAALRAYQIASEVSQTDFSLKTALDFGNILTLGNYPQQALEVYQHAFKDKETILIFSPDTGVYPHFVAQCVVGKVLQDQGHTVIVLPCGEIYHPFLLPSLEHTQQWFNTEYAHTCSQRYRQTAQKVLSKYGLPSIEVRAFLNREDFQEVSEISTLILQRQKDLRDFLYKNIRVGKLSIFDLALTTKHFDFSQVSPTVHEIWIQFIEKNILAYKALSKIYQSFKISSGIHFNDYSPMLIHRLVGEESHVPVYSLTQASHLNIDRRRYILVPQTLRQTAFLQESSWTKFRELHLSPSTVKQIGDDILHKFRGIGSHAYSPAKQTGSINLYRHLNLSTNRYLIVAYTSSWDEVMSVRAAMDGLGIQLPQKAQPFSDQIVWLKSLVRFVESSEHLQLIVRVHPRESRNKRDSQISQHLTILLENFNQSFSHCQFIWPEDSTSSYDLAELADLVLTSWSSMGLECARIGIPVLTATNGIAPFPHDDFLEWGQTPEQYFQKLSCLIHTQVTLGQIIRAFRWYNLYHLGTSVNLEDVIPSSDFTGLPESTQTNAAKVIQDIIVNRQDILDINYYRLNNQQSEFGEFNEAVAIIQQLTRVLHFILRGNDFSSTEDLKLEYFSGIYSLHELKDIVAQHIQSTSSIATIFVSTKNKHIFYITPDGQAFEKYSPLCTRLVKLICNIEPHRCR